MVRALKTGRHSSAISRMFRLLISEDTPGFCANVQCPIRLDDYNEPVADIALLSGDFDSVEQAGAKDMLLAIEVADTQAEVNYDQKIKLPLYARSGIPELWIFVLADDEIEVSRQPTPEGYADVQVYRRGDTLTINELPDVRLAVDELLS